MDPLKLNIFQGVSGAQPIAPMDGQSSGAPAPVEDAPPALEIDVTPDVDGEVDTSSMSLDFEDKLKKFEQ